MKAIRLLSLASVVPFPGQTYWVGCCSRDLCEDGATTTVGLLHRGKAVGCMATITAVSDEMICCKTSTQRFQLASPSAELGLDGVVKSARLQSVDPFDDDDADGDANAELQADVWQLVTQLQEVRAADAMTGGHHLDPAECPSAFSFALASASELDLADSQALLECTSACERLTRLKKRLESAIAFAATQKMLAAFG